MKKKSNGAISGDYGSTAFVHSSVLPKAVNKKVSRILWLLNNQVWSFALSKDQLNCYLGESKSFVLFWYVLVCD